MSKKKDTRQLLIESSEFVTKILLPQTLKESLEISNSKAGTLIVRNIPATILNRENQNGRIYTTEVLQEAIDEAKRLKAFELKGMLGKPNEHPEGSYIAPSEASHVVINAYIKKNTRIMVEGKEEVHDVLFMDWEVLNTQNGKDLRALFEAECSIGVSIRGLGDLEGKYVKNYTLISCDCVGNPSSSTFTRMPVSESVEVELKNNKDLQEGFTVSSSSTTVVKDLNQASELQSKLEDINYGTVVKTSTKLDSETDPKTGAETTITTLEAETEDEVGDLNQALMMAKNAMLNGYVDIDSVTIENIKEEEPKEAVENEVGDEASLNEEDNDDTERYETCVWCNEKLPLSDLRKEKQLGYICNRCAKAIASREGKLDFEDEYIPESEMNKEVGSITVENPEKDESKEMKEAKEDKKDPKEGKKFVLKTPSGFVAMDGNALVFKENPKEALHFIVGKEESGLVHLSGVQKILDTMGVYDVEKYYRKPTTDISTPNEIANNETPAENENSTGEEKLQEFGDVNIGDVASNNNVSDNNDTLNEEDNTGGRYTAIVETNGLGGEVKSEEIPVASTELSSMQNEISNLWQQKSQNGQVTIKIRDNETDKTYAYNPESNEFEELTESLSNDGEIQQDKNKLSLEIDKDHKVEKKFDTEAQASVAKAGIEKGSLDGSVLLNEDKPSLSLNGHFDRASQTYLPEFIGNENDIKLAFNYIKRTLPYKEIYILKDMHSPNKFSVMFDEYIRESTIEMLINKLEKFFNIDVTTENLNEGSPVEADIIPGWYITCPGAMDAGIDIGILGPYESKEEARNATPELQEYEALLKYEYISPEDIKGFDENNMNEVLYNKPTDPSDPYVNETLNEEDEDDDIGNSNNIKELNIDELSKKGLDSENNLTDTSDKEDIGTNSEDIQITLGNIDWDIDSINDNFMTNAQDDDIATQSDLESLVNDLPDTLSLTIKSSDIDMDEPDKVKEVLLDLANKSSGLKINNAMILDIK